MRACKSALAALDALSRIPCRNQSSNVSLLTECDVFRNRSIDDIFLHEFGYRHIFAFEGVDALDEIIIVAIACGRVQRSAAVEISPFRLHIDLDQSGAAHLNCGDVGIDDILTLASIGMSSTVLHELEGLAVRHDLLIELEECGLQDRIGMTAHMALDRQTGSVDDVEVCMLLSKTCEHAVRHLGSNLVCREGCIQKERAAFLQLTDHVELVAVAVQRAGDEVCLIDVVRRMDRGLAETQMRTGNAAGLLGVVLEISLGIQIRVVADDLDGGLVRADSSIRTKTEEQAGSIIGLHLQRNRIQRQMRHIIVDGQRELFLRIFFLEFFINCIDVRRVGILGGQSVAAADDGQAFMMLEGIADIQIQRLSGADFLGTIQNSNLLDRLRENCFEILDGERTIQINLDQTYLLAFCSQSIDRLGDGIRNGAHSDDDTLSIRSTDIGERCIVAASVLGNSLHVLSSDISNCCIVLILSFTSLEEDVIVLVAAADNRIGMRVHRMRTECLELINRQQRLQIVIVHDFDLVDFVRSTETIEEVHDRYRTVNGNQVSNASQVHAVLNGVGAHHDNTSLTACIDILVIAEDGKCMSC